jgi:hypothetical protein
VSLTKIRKIRLLEQLESSLCLVHCDRVVLDLILHLEPSLELKHRFLPCPRAKSSAIATVEGADGVEVVVRPGTAVAKDVVGVMYSMSGGFR